MSTITIDLNELRTLLIRVVPFALQDKYGLPFIQSVHLEGKGEYLIATATDRYIVGMTRTKVENADGFQALVKIQDIKHILATFKSRKGIITTVTLTTSGGAADSSRDSNLTVTLADGMFADADDLTARYGLLDGDFPKVAGLFSAWAAPTEFASVGYNPAYLAKFAHVVERGGPIKVAGGGVSKPTIVQAGDYFIGAIMPVRLNDDAATELSDWTTLLETPKPKAVRAPRKAAAKAPAAKTAAKKTAAAAPKKRATKKAAAA